VERVVVEDAGGGMRATETERNQAVENHCALSLTESAVVLTMHAADPVMVTFSYFAYPNADLFGGLLVSNLLFFILLLAILC